MKNTHKFLNLNSFSPQSSYSPWGFPSHFWFMVFKWLLSFDFLIVIQWLPITPTIKSQCITIAVKSLYYLAPIGLSNSITLYGLPSLCQPHQNPQICQTLRNFFIDVLGITLIWLDGSSLFISQFSNVSCLSSTNFHPTLFSLLHLLLSEIISFIDCLLSRT